MIKFKIEDKQYFIDDFLSIENYAKIYKIKDLFNEDYFAAKLVSIVSDAPLEDLLECPYEDISYLAYSILENIPTDKNTEFKDTFELNGIEYGFFPNWKDLTFAEFADMDTISNKKIDELLDMLHILTAVMYRPIISKKSDHNYEIEKYDVKTLEKRAEEFKKFLDVRYVIGAQFFFIKFANKSSNYSQIFSTPNLSIWEKIKMIWMMWRMVYKITSKKHMDGSWLSTELRKMILQSTNTSTKRN